MRLLLLCTCLLASAHARAQDTRTPPIFTVEHEGSTLYLLGSIHALPDDGRPLPATIDSLYARATQLAFEVDLGRTDELAAIYARATDAAGLAEVASPALLGRVDEVLLRAALPKGTLDTYEPWYAAIVLSVLPSRLDSLHTVGPGVDAQLYSRARGEGLPVYALETLNDQVRGFESMPADQQVRYVETVLSNLEAAPMDAFGEMVTAWETGQDKALLQLVDAGFGGFAPLAKALLDTRNRNWIPMLREFLGQPGQTTLAVVGAAHLFGEASVVDLLRLHGYTVRRL
jgi:uncharacterized protein YbaP (TraB family)